MIRELKASQVRHKINPQTLGIKNTLDITPLEGVIGQKRAVSALNFGLGIQNSGFNLFVAGPPGIGKMSAIKSFLEDLATKKAVPPDPWGARYIYKFPGDHGDYDLSSLGADGQPGGIGEAADVTSWGS